MYLDCLWFVMYAFVVLLIGWIRLDGRTILDAAVSSRLLDDEDGDGYSLSVRLDC